MLVCVLNSHMLPKIIMRRRKIMIPRTQVSFLFILSLIVTGCQSTTMGGGVKKGSPSPQMELKEVMSYAEIGQIFDTQKVEVPLRQQLDYTTEKICKPEFGPKSKAILLRRGKKNQHGVEERFMGCTPS